MRTGDMSISAFSRRSLLSVKALRLYDETGLLRPDSVDPSSGYRYYSESQLEVARLISLLRRAGMPLAEIRELVGQPSAEAARMLSCWWESEEERYATRKNLVQYIGRSVLEGEDSVDDLPYQVRLREIPTTTYLYVSRHLHGPELPDYIGSSEAYLHERASAYGGGAGLLTVVFQGVVDLDSDGPVDVCLPIAEGSRGVGDDLIRTESAHTQAYISLTRPQVAFPQILQVYQAIRQWIGDSDYEISGPPREIYLGEFDAVQSDTLICDVAFPIRSTR